MSTPTQDGQISVNGLLMGRGTAYGVHGFKAWARRARHNQQPRPWEQGSWSGREVLDAETHALRIVTRGTDAATWMGLHWDLCAAFAPADHPVELQYQLGGRRYVVFGRPRLVDPEVETLGTGQVWTAAAFEALDPRHYSADEHSLALSLPVTSGGLTVPFTVPFAITATAVAGFGTVANLGISETALFVRINANGQPLIEPRISLRIGANPASTLRAQFTLDAGQWLDLDTGRRTARVNGQSTRTGLMSGTWPVMPGRGAGEAAATAELGFDAGTYSAVAQLLATWRDAW